MSASAGDPAGAPGTQSPGGHKSALRKRLLADRRTRQPDPWTEDQREVAVLAIPEVAAATVVAGYTALPGEPDIGPALAALRLRGVRVLLPVTLPDRDLEFGESPASASKQALAEADVVLIPAVAADRRGYRLGRGGGSYDRALPRARPNGLRIAVIHSDELLEEVPVEAHDVRLDGVLAGIELVRAEPA